MKKLLYVSIVLLAFMMPKVSEAQQSQNYYLTGDTIVGRSPIYFYQWWSEAWLSDTSHKLTLLFGSESEPQNFWLIPFGEILQYCYTETPLNIIGIATSCVPEFSANDPGNNPSWQEYVRLYDAAEDDFVLLKQVPYSYGTPVRYMELERWDFDIITDLCCEHIEPPELISIPIREYYFDKPVTVYDSFYVGYTTESYCLDFHPESPTGIFYHMNGKSYGWVNDSPDNCSNPCDKTPFQLHKYRHLQKDMDPLSSTYGDTIDKNWHWTQSRLFMLQFPIVVIDSSYIIPPYECPPVQNVRIAQQGEGMAYLMWDTHPDQNSWQISYGSEGVDPDSGTVVNCPMQVGRIEGLDSCTHYTAYVRAVCDHDSICYSSWSDPVDIYICDTTGGGGGEPEGFASAVNMLTYVVPNPATTQVNVYSSFQISRVEVFTLQGRRMTDVPVQGNATAFNVNEWPSGVYIVTVHTQAGNVAKKLVVR